MPRELTKDDIKELVAQYALSAACAQEAGLDPAKITDIAATGPGGRVSGDDVMAHLAKNKA